MSGVLGVSVLPRIVLRSCSSTCLWAVRRWTPLNAEISAGDGAVSCLAINFFALLRGFCADFVTALLRLTHRSYARAFALGRKRLVGALLGSFCLAIVASRSRV